MIIEAIISTLDKKNGRANFAPMGVHLADHASSLARVGEVELCLYRGSQTYDNLYSTSEGVINLSEDVLAFVETALFSRELPSSPSKMVSAPRMSGASAIFEFSVVHFEAAAEPARVKGKILYHEQFGGFTGFCRARSAVLEAVIMATRLDRIPLSEINEYLDKCEQIILKTGGAEERKALQRVKDFLLKKDLTSLPRPG